MKRFLLIAIIILSVLACKKIKYSPEGPTDIRIRNLSNLPFTDVTVNTSDPLGTINIGNIGAGNESEYFRFEKAYPKAEISANAGGKTYSTSLVDYTYMTILGQGKFTYVVLIETETPPRLKISEVIPDAPLD
jgi:hypothetical protein